MSAFVYLLAKELRLELRGKEAAPTLALFALVTLLLAKLGVGLSSDASREIAPAILWIALLFAAVLGAQRAADKDREILRGVLLTPAPRMSIFFAKAAAQMTFLMAAALVQLPVLSAFFDAPIGRRPDLLSTALLLALLGIAVVATLAATALASMRLRGILLPLTLMPLATPILICAVKATSAALYGEGWAEAGPWLRILAATDAILLGVSALLFEYSVEE